MTDTPPAQGPGSMPPPGQAPGPMPPVQPPAADWQAARPPAVPAGLELATYGKRVAAYLIDALIGLLLSVPGVVVLLLSLQDVDDDNVNGGLLTVGILLILVGIVIVIWNQGWRQGAVGHSWGKGFVGINLVRASDGVPPGGWVGLGRYFLRQVLGNVTGGIYTVLTLLWPLWDDRRQTLDDKILSTLVVDRRYSGY